ncbi:unnamed protein product [Trichobilharzia regenti]|nr:unnamed protein product [Trichobilharzia regenti]
MQSLPVGTWLPDTNHATWRIPLQNANIDRDTLKTSNNSHRSEFALKFDATGTVRAKFTLTNGPGRPQPVSLQFFREGSTASGVQLTVISSDYRMNLCKQRLIGDRYMCDPPNNANRYHSNSLLALEHNTVNKDRGYNTLTTDRNKTKNNENEMILANLLSFSDTRKLDHLS